MKHKSKGQVIVYVVMRDPQANMLQAHRVYYSERRAKNYCKKMNADVENFSGMYYIQKCLFTDFEAFLTKFSEK
jgi:hypothetical protein